MVNDFQLNQIQVKPSTKEDDKNKHIEESEEEKEHKTVESTKEKKRSVPYNAVINGGAITMCTLFQPHAGSSEKFKNCLTRFSELAGSELGFDQEYYLKQASKPHGKCVIKSILC